MNIFSCNIKNIKSFKLILSIIKDIHIDITLIITKKSITITSFENSKNILVHIELPSENFIDYLCLVDKFIITTGSQNLYKIINKISNKSSLNLCIRDDDYIDKQVHYINITTDHTFIKIKLNENPSIEITLPVEDDKKHKTRFFIEKNDLIHVIKNMDLIHDYINIHTQLNQVTFSCNGQYAKSSVSFPNYIQSIEMASIDIPMYIMKLFTKINYISDQALFTFAHGIPFNISYNIQDLGNLHFYYKNYCSI